jgi:hypothetical protein
MDLLGSTFDPFTGEHRIRRGGGAPEDGSSTRVGPRLGESTVMYEPWGGADKEPLITAHDLARLFAWALPFVEEEAPHVNDDPPPGGRRG